MPNKKATYLGVSLTPPDCIVTRILLSCFSQPPAVFTKDTTGANEMRQEAARDFSRYLAGQLPPHLDALYNATSLLGAHREENPRVE